MWGAGKNVICDFWAPYRIPDLPDLTCVGGRACISDWLLRSFEHSGYSALGLHRQPQWVTPASCCVFAEHRIQTGASASNPEGRAHSTECPRQWAACRDQRLGLYARLGQQQRLSGAAEGGDRERRLWVRAAGRAGCCGVPVQTRRSHLQSHLGWKIPTLVFIKQAE